MNLINFLRKIGVLRYGVKTYEYHSGRDMTPEALMADVYDAEKDLVSKKDIDALKKKLKGEKGE